MVVQAVVGWVQEVELVAAPGTAVGGQAMVEVLSSAPGEAGRFNFQSEYICYIKSDEIRYIYFPSFPGKRDRY